MYILIDNAGFENKGAELMLRSIVKKSIEKYPNCICVVPPHSIGGLYAPAIGEGLYIYQDHYLASFVPQKYLQKLYFVKSSKIDMVLDAGGFQFSDQWVGRYSKESNKKVKNYYQKLKGYGAKIIFLPQAYGPFELPLSKERIKIVFDYADMLFARDQISYNYLVDIFGKHDKIYLMPDFTTLLKPELPLGKFIKKNKYIGIIPNFRMVNNTNKDISSKYLTFLKCICQLFIDIGEELILLNHEGKKDEKIINEIQKDLSGQVLVLNGLNALEVKEVIGKMKLLVSSRFHGVVSGLSQGVCTFCTGWSHKYSELLADYGVCENLLDIQDFDECRVKLDEALSNNKSVFHVEDSFIKAQKEKSHYMWDLIWQRFDN